MLIGNKEYKEIIITNDKKEVLAHITDSSIIERNGINVNLSKNATYRESRSENGAKAIILD